MKTKLPILLCAMVAIYGAQFTNSPTSGNVPPYPPNGVVHAQFVRGDEMIRREEAKNVILSAKGLNWWSIDPATIEDRLRGIDTVITTLGETNYVVTVSQLLAPQTNAIPVMQLLPRGVTVELTPDAGLPQISKIQVVDGGVIFDVTNTQDQRMSIDRISVTVTGFYPSTTFPEPPSEDSRRRQFVSYISPENRIYECGWIWRHVSPNQFLSLLPGETEPLKVLLLCEKPGFAMVTITVTTSVNGGKKTAIGPIRVPVNFGKEPK